MLGDRPNQLDRQRPEVEVTAAELLDVASAGGEITEAGLRTNLSVGVAYTAAWLAGNGAVALHNLMEDAATAEISRSQVWQHLRARRRARRHRPHDDRPSSCARCSTKRSSTSAARCRPSGSPPYTEPAARLIAELCLSDEYVDFLTLPAYELLD